MNKINENERYAAICKKNKNFVFLDLSINKNNYHRTRKLLFREIYRSF